MGWGQQGEVGEVSGQLPLSLRGPCSAWPVLSYTGPSAPGCPVLPDGGASQDPSRLSSIPPAPLQKHSLQARSWGSCHSCFHSHQDPNHPEGGTCSPWDYGTT